MKVIKLFKRNATTPPSPPLKDALEKEIKRTACCEKSDNPDIAVKDEENLEKG